MAPSLAESSLVGRLAPSPTGAQHLGNARTYLLAWLSIRSKQGSVVFRIEDIDSPRIKPWASIQAYDDLQWLGLDWDIGPSDQDLETCSSQVPDHVASSSQRLVSRFIQSHQVKRYNAYLQQLIDRDLVYPCTCSRSDIEQSASAPHVGMEGNIYPGTCSERRASDYRQLDQRPFAWRLRVPDEVRTWEDQFQGFQSANLNQALGDFVVGKADGTPSYQLSVVIDDHEMGVTEVVRGDDLIPSTFRQLLLYELFDWQHPIFYHVPLVIGPDGKRLAKRHGDTRLSWFREQGISPEAIVGYLAYSSGLLDRQIPCSASQLIHRFSWANLRREKLVVDQDQVLRNLREMMKQ